MKDEEDDTIHLINEDNSSDDQVANDHLTLTV
jgi:hypothetical protein